MSAHLALHLLGPPTLELNHAPVSANRRKALALLAYLALNRGGHTRDFISALLWPEYDQTKALTNLRHTLWEIQQTIGDGWVLAARETVALEGHSGPSADPDQHTVWLDVDEFQDLMSRSRAENDAAARLPILTAATALYRNDLLTGFSLKDAPAFNEWMFARSEALRHQLADALSILAGSLASLGQPQPAVAHLQRLIGMDPLNESWHRQLMQVYVQLGQDNAALKQYQTCEKILRKELGVDPQPETRALYKQIRKGASKPNPPATIQETATPQHNLPLQLSSFVGREKELGEIATLIARHRLVTLTGPGGIGKTRLSLKAGERLLGDYPNGVWLVEMAPLSDATRVPQTVASLFNLVEGSEEALSEKLVSALRPKTLLLIIDNCEHVLEACAQLADTLIKNCPNLKILATSREALNITGEAVYHVPSLALPEAQKLLEKLLQFESVQLFEERGRLVQRDFSLTLDNAASIAQICQRLDGIPLAIELAAARVNIFSPEQIAERLNGSFRLLTGGGRTALPRHQTLQASIDWSWELLSEAERTLLRRLSIFAGGWTLDAAESVCAGDGIQAEQILGTMAQLTAKSLIVVDQISERERRYHLLEMIRQYAHEKLTQAGEEEPLRVRHLKYFLDLSDQIERELVGPQQVEWLARAHAERDNLRAALEQASRSDLEAGLYVSSRLRRFWETFDNLEGTRWLSLFLQRPQSHEYPLARAKALATQGWFLALSQQFDAARSAANEALGLCRAWGDPYGEVDSLNVLGFISGGDEKIKYCQQALALARSLGDAMRQSTALTYLGWNHRDLERALAYWQEEIPLYRQIGNRIALAECLSRLGHFLVLDGDIETAQEYLDEAAGLYQQLNAKTGLVFLTTAYGQIALMQGDYTQARFYFQQNARIGKELGNRMDYLWGTVRLGGVELREGNLTEARRIFIDCAREFQKDRFVEGVVFALECMATLYITVGKDEDAARLIGWCDTTREAISDTRPIFEQANIDRDCAAVVIRLGKAAFEDAYQTGCALSTEEAVALALRPTHK